MWDEELGRPLAAKLASATVSRDREPLYKFLVEAQITGQLSHPGIVPVHELGITEHRRPYLLMKRVRGRDLSQLVAMLRATPSGGPVVVPELAGEPSPLVGLLQTFQRVCEAVAFAHSHGVIHRDLKPANIMVGEFGEVLVVDWGLAKVLGQEPGSPDQERIVRPDPGTSRIARSGLGAALRPQGTVDDAVVGTAS